LRNSDCFKNPFSVCPKIYTKCGLHENEELLEINAGKLEVCFQLAKNSVENSELKLLRSTFAVCGSLLKLTPVKST